MKLTTKQITMTAVLLAISIVSMFFKNASVYITGPIVNAALIIAAVYCGVVCSVVLSIITPIASFLITGAPVMAAIPAMFPCVMAGNIVLVLAVALLRKKLGKAGLPVSIIIGSVIKAAVMGVLISLILLPNFLPEAMSAMMKPLQLQFSLVQLITALIGGVYAVLIHFALKKAHFEEA